MTRKTVINIALWILPVAFSAHFVWRGVQGFQTFRSLNPDSGIVEYVLSANPGIWFGLLAAIGVGFIGHWTSRVTLGRRSSSDPNAEREDSDEGSKRLFSEARGQ